MHWVVKKKQAKTRNYFKRLFKFQMPSAILKAIYNTKCNKKNSDLGDTIKSGIFALTGEIKEMPEEEK